MTVLYYCAPNPACRTQCGEGGLCLSMRPASSCTLTFNAKDVLAFGRAYLELCQIGGQPTGPRSLDQLADQQGPVPLEVRNRATVTRSFFTTAFQMVRETHIASGVAYAVEANKILRNEDLATVERLEGGTNQFFEFGAIPGPNTYSVWASAEGFFYALSYQSAQVAQRNYNSPIWILQASHQCSENRCSTD